MAKARRRTITLAIVGGAAWYALRLISPDGVPLDTLPALEAGSCGSKCGVERWVVKTLTDRSRDLIRLQPTRATIAELGAIPRPPGLPPADRVAPVELTVYQVDGYLGGSFPENDGDIHLILFDPDNQRASLVAEIPNASCAGVCNSGLGHLYTTARAVLDTVLNTPNPSGVPIRLRVTGVGFFDHPHGQIGAAPNNLELHPVLRLEKP